MTTKKITRRAFLAASAASGAVFAAPLVLGADKTKKYRIALIGSGWWGMNIARTAIEAGESEIVALCDVDRNQLQRAAGELDKLTGVAPREYMDYRELLEREKPEIVIVATPDHWHALATIAAVEAGAHVYVEKPISHTILEGSAMVKAARDNDRVVQVGTHRRVSPHNIWAMDFLKQGKLGRIGMARAFVYSGGGPGRSQPDETPPDGLDWDMWCGPAPLRPYNRAIHPKGFRHFLDYANGTLGDWGIHWLDHILWWSEEKYPQSVSSTGGRHIRRDNSDAPDTQTVQYEFESFTAVWEHRRYGGLGEQKNPVGICFHGEEGTLHIGWRDGATFYPQRKGGQEIHVEPQLHLPDNQNIPELWADFLECIKTGRRPVCDIEIGHRSTTMSLLGMLSYKLGRSVRWDGEKEVIDGDAEANRLLRREYRAPWKYPEA
jgi:predicted dehydrogenase